ncbi:MAG TPA: hypothetical protein VF040_13315 [Ktedonobacterales bacterium]
MAPRPALQVHLSTIMVAIILVACSASGLLAGISAHALATGLGARFGPSGPVISGTPPSHASATATVTSDATATAIAANMATNFMLSVTVSPRELAPGDTFTVTVQATSNDAPVSGLSCTLRAPTSGPAGLFDTWPAPVTTNDSGEAVWTLTVPSVKSGTYAIEADAVGAHHYEFHRYVTVTVR